MELPQSTVFTEALALDSGLWGFLCETSLRLSKCDRGKRSVAEEPGRDSHISSHTSLNILLVWYLL